MYVMDDMEVINEVYPCEEVAIDVYSLLEA